MLILNRDFGAPAFATADDGAVWRLALSPDGVEDAIHHDGRFHSVSYSGVVEVWDRDVESGAYTGTTIAPRLATVGIEEDEGRSSPRKYLAAAPGGRLMVVVKHAQAVTKDKRYSVYNPRKSWTWAFKVHVLDDDGQWKETRDIGDTALFVGLNNSLCVPTVGRTNVEAGCVYYANDDLWLAAAHTRDKNMDHSDDDDDERDGHVIDPPGMFNLTEIQAVGVYNLKDGTVKKVEGLNRQQYRSFTYTPPVWIMPSIP
jgi:hypothetical protein